MRSRSAPAVGHPYFGLLSAPDLVEACVLAGARSARREAFAVFEGFARRARRHGRLHWPRAAAR